MKTKFNLFEMLTPKSTTYFVEEEINIRQALEKFAFHKYTVVPILNKDGEYVGSISEGDILRYLAAQNFSNKREMEKTRIADIERYRQYQAVNVDATFDELYAASLSQNFIPVVDDRNIFIGIVKRREIMILLKEMTEKIPE